MAKERIITFLHVFDDEKFFDEVSAYFDGLSILKNIYIYYTSEKNYRFKYIKNVEKVKIVNDFKEYTSYFSKPEIDVVYFQGLCNRDNFKLAKYIGSKQKVIWWCFGAEIYDGLRLPPLVKLPLLKPLTKQCYTYFQRRTISSLFKRFAFFFLNGYYIRQRRLFLKRVDYLSPVLPIDYELLCKNVKEFYAKPFMLQCGPARVPDFPLIIKNEPGYVMVGNSLTYSNNLLDIAEIIREITMLGHRKYLFPISYGDDYGGKDNIKKMVNIADDNVKWLDSFIPIKEYINIFDNISHAIFGFVRQQGVGNIGLCLRKGIKVYLYKDSVLYKQYTNWGYKVFSIEDDLTEESLNSCLSEEDARLNHQLSLKHFRFAHYEFVEKEIEDMFINE